jgi:hypothetical protein
LKLVRQAKGHVMSKIPEPIRADLVYLQISQVLLLDIANRLKGESYIGADLRQIRALSWPARLRRMLFS